jgi:hypothetical protein
MRSRSSCRWLLVNRTRAGFFAVLPAPSSGADSTDAPSSSPRKNDLTGDGFDHRGRSVVGVAFGAPSRTTEDAMRARWDSHAGEVRITEANRLRISAEKLVAPAGLGRHESYHACVLGESTETLPSVFGTYQESSPVADTMAFASGYDSCCVALPSKERMHDPCRSATDGVKSGVK